MSEIFDISKVEDYKNLLANFAAISSVPRGSGFNEKISSFLCDFAKEQGLWYRQDDALNVIIRKPASKGLEGRPAAVLQGHMDMVCVKDPGIDHDFEKEGLDLRMDGEWMFANGTTLGADDGIAVAYMLSILADKNAVHPELICIITTDEETGMDGAYALDFSDLKDAKYLINIDSEDERVCLSGCAGGLRVDGRIPVKRENKTGEAMTITFKNLRGGHSGAEIHQNITNAIRLMARTLLELEEVADYNVIELFGGEKDNAIPSSVTAKILLNSADKAAVESLLKRIYSFYRVKESRMELETAYEQGSFDVVTKDSFANVLFVLLEAPNGVQAMEREIEGIVETSLNLGIFELARNEAKFNYSLRSSVASEKAFLSRRLRMLLERAGGSGRENAHYPAWEYKADSKLRDAYIAACEKVLGVKPESTVIHAGLECGLFAEKLPQLDMISVGPAMHDIHTPRERLSMPSAVRLYKVFEELLAKIN